MLGQVPEGLLPAPAEGAQAGVHHQPGGAHQRRADRAEQAALVGVQPGFRGELLGVQAPALREYGEAAPALQRGQAGEQLQAGELQVMPGHRFVEGYYFDAHRSPAVGRSVLNQNVPGRLLSRRGGV